MTEENNKKRPRSGTAFLAGIIILILACVFLLRLCSFSKLKANVPIADEQQVPYDAPVENQQKTVENSENISTDEKMGKVYFCRLGDDGTQRLLPAYRKFSTQKIGETSLEQVLTALLSGPTNAETSHDIVTNIPENVHLKAVRIENETAILDFSEEFEFNPYGRDSTMLQLGQVVFTATECQGINQVLFLINGEVHTYLGGDGVTIGKPLSRDDFS